MDCLEVRILVGSFLDSHDLCSCVRVSKLWHESFLPFIYDQAKPTSFHLHWRSFQPQLRHVRDLSIIRVTEPHEKAGFLKNCRRLVRLNFASDPYPAAIDYLIRLLQRNPQLVRVALWILEGTLYQKLWRTLVDDCPRLTEIELHGTNFQGESLIGFMNLTLRLTRLELGNCNLSHLLEWMSSPSPSPFGSAELQSNVYHSNDNRVVDDKDWPGFPVLHELIITGSYGNNTWMDQLQVFVRAPKLERLSWKIVDLKYTSSRVTSAEEFIPTLVRVLRQRTWPRLHSLEVTEDDLGRQSTLNDEQLAEILTLLPDGLKSFRIPGASFGLLAWQAIQRHLGTLRVLQLTEVPSWMVQGFLTSCPDLRELRGPTLNTSDLVRGVQADLAREKNAIAVAAMLAAKGLPEALMAPLPRKEVLLSADTKRKEVSASIENLDDDEWPTEEGLLSVPSLPEDQSPRPWICHRLKVLRITLRGHSKERELGKKGADAQAFQQLMQLKWLVELLLCPFEDALRVDGLNPRLVLGVDLGRDAEFRGHFINAARIRKYAVGQRLLEIWPGLTSCYFQRL